MAKTQSEDFPEIASANTPTNKQRLFIRYFTAILIDLVVLGLFDEYWRHVEIDSFTIILLAAILMQFLLKGTLALEHRVAGYFNSKDGKLAKFMRYFSAWFILFASKFVMLGLIDLMFGDEVYFGGPLHGILAFFVVVFAMLGAEEGVVRFTRSLR